MARMARVARTHGWTRWSAGLGGAAVAAAFAVSGGWSPRGADAAAPSGDSLRAGASVSERAPGVRAAATAPQQQVAFESNAGQFPEGVAFVARGRGVTARLLDDGADLLLLSMPRDGGPGSLPTPTRDAGPPEVDRLRMRFDGSAPSRACGEGLLPWRTNHFTGSDPAAWRTDVPGYESARQAEVWPGVDAVWTSSGRALEYSFHAEPGADPSRIAFRLEGATAVRVEDDGSLAATTRLGTLRQSAPVAWDVTPAGRTPVRAAFRLAEDGLVAFDLAGHDPARPLVIDPKLDWATFVGGSGTDYPRGGSIDASGNVLLAGYTTSADYPVGSPAQAALGGGTDACVTKLSADGTAILFSSYLGGSNTDQAWDVIATPAGKTIVIGYTASTNWPVTQGSIRTSYAGGTQDGFVTQLSASGAAIDWSTYLGGSALDSGYAVALDLAGDIYVTGYTASADFPTTAGGRQPAYGGGGQDGFLAKIKATGDAFVFSTFHGGGGDDIGFRVRVDATGSPYICGSTSSSDFPLQNAYDSTISGPYDSYVAKFNTSGSALVYSTLIGGSNFDYAYTLTVDTKGFAAIGGVTASADFPVVTPFQPAYAGGSIDGWVAKFAANGSSLLWASYYGGSGNDYVQSLALDDAGGCCFGGFTYSIDVPLKDPIQGTRGGSSPTTYSDVLFGRTEPDGSALAYGSYFGGSFSEDCYGLALEPSGVLRLIGATGSSDLPVQGGVQTSFGGGSFDVFVARVSPLVPNAPTNLTASLAAAVDVQLQWTDASFDESGFELQRRRNGGPWSKIKDLAAGESSYLDRFLATNSTFDWRVRAVNSEGPSPWSNEATVTVPPGSNSAPPPLAPSDLTVLVVSGTEVQLDWVDKSLDETRFEIERRVGGLDFTQIGFVPADGTSMPDRTLVTGWPHVWRVRAVAPQGPSSWTISRYVTTPATMEFALTKGTVLTSSPKAKKDKLRLKGTFVPPAGSPELFDPSATGMRFQAGPTSAPFVLAVAAGDPAWKKAKKTGIWTWKSPKKTLPAFTVTVNPKKRTFDLNLTSGDLPADATNPFRVLVAVGTDGAALVKDWTEGKGGKFTLPR